ncbi:hypothetical protein K8354_04500 [Polaribacter litorisediminis]|uniref:DUF6090 family protein n=1 Tax=Polaribacter litorisediminis TaxID=1908341 RepID=UPI001CBE6868|nr:DUF6090 family protein [Polaribacter litorisediminis]UAM99091.1 hypothetical protein K8354_04500 [Polaribacter litorisediminis]
MEKNKTGKYLKYAIGEIVLVMIGILLALQVSNWNQDRKDRISERKILNNINRDFIQNKASFDLVKVDNYKNLAVLDSIVQILKEGGITIEKYNKYNKLIIGNTYNPYSSTVDAVINSNSLELIQDDELQKYLVSWKDVLADYLEGETRYFKFVNEQWRTYILENSDWAGKNREMNMKVLSSIKFRNHIMAKRALMHGIIKSIEEEPIENHINEIIRLTEPKN